MEEYKWCHYPFKSIHSYINTVYSFQASNLLLWKIGLNAFKKQACMIHTSLSSSLWGQDWFKTTSQNVSSLQIVNWIAWNSCVHTLKGDCPSHFQVHAVLQTVLSQLLPPLTQSFAVTFKLQMNVWWSAFHFSFWLFRLSPRSSVTAHVFFSALKPPSGKPTHFKYESLCSPFFESSAK